MGVLVPIPWQPSIVLRPETLLLLTAASIRLGTQLRVQGNGGWRSWDDQNYWYQLYRSGKGNPASNPDTGNRFHMRGAAFDLVRTDTAAQAACRAVGLVRDPAESWHWNHPRWASFPVIKANIAPAGLNTEEIDDMQADERAALMEIRDNMPGRPNVHPDGDLWKKVLHLEALVVAVNDNLRGDVAAVPEKTWGYRLDHTLAKDAEGKALAIPAGDYLRYEPAEHDGTRRAVAAVARPDVDLDYAAVVAELKASGLDPATFATYAADEADKRERERLAS